MRKLEGVLMGVVLFIRYTTPLSQSISLPASSVYRVIDARAGNGRPVSCPHSTSSSSSGILCHTLFPLGNSFTRFVVPSAFTPSGWCLRKLTLQEKLALRDYPVDTLSCFSVPKQRLLLHWDAIPSRVLGFLFRFMLMFSGAGGGKVKLESDNPFSESLVRTTNIPPLGV